MPKAKIKHPGLITRKLGGQRLWLMIIITFALLLVFRVGSFITLPLINTRVLTNTNFGKAFGFLDIFSGGALGRFSVLALGIGPYITATIVTQLLEMDVIPKLKEWREEGESGRKKISDLNKYIALGLAFLQALLLTLGIKVQYGNGIIKPKVADPSFFMFVYLALVATAGTAFSIWLAEKITAHGVGNGTSLLIVTGILSAFPEMIMGLVNNLLKEQKTKNSAGKEVITKVTAGNIVLFVACILLLIGIVITVCFMERSQRKIPVQYANRPAQQAFQGKGDSNIPIKLNTPSVIPVIFAGTIMSLPTTVVQVSGGDSSTWGKTILSIFSPSKPIGFCVYVVLIVIFCFFYGFMQINPDNMAKDLQKQNGFIPGVRPGEETASYISRVLFKVTVLGATYLVILASLPIIFGWIFPKTQSLQLGGTGLIIVVGVAIETVKQLFQKNQDLQYTGFSRGYIPK